jgi:DNA-binding NarL/FixJ family response regulator
MATGLVISTDLLFADSLCQRAKAQGKLLEMRSLESAKDFPDSHEVSILLVDLSSLGAKVVDAIAAFKNQFPNARITAFGPHVHEGLLQSAMEAGCDEVLTRGQMNQFAQRYINQL